MEHLSEYILSITAAALLCAIAQRIIGRNTLIGSMIKMICGVFLTVSVLSPIVKMKLDDLEFYYQDFKLSADEISGSGITMANNTMEDIILDKTEAYILDEAMKIGLTVQVKIQLSDSIPPVPVGIDIHGDASPYRKSQLCRIITENLEIAGENIQWI